MVNGTLLRRLGATLLTAVLMFSPSWNASAQAVAIAPDQATLTAPFTPADEAAFLKPDKVFFPETWFHFIDIFLGVHGTKGDVQRKES